MYVPDAPWIREAERNGCEYMYDWVGLGEGDEEEEKEPYFDCDRADLEVGYNPYTGSYDFDC